MARWVHSFRRVSTREISEEERESYRRLARRRRATSYLWGSLAVALFFAGLVTAMIASDGHAWVWPLFILELVLFFWSIGRANDAERRSLLCRRIVRVGRFDRLERETMPDYVRRSYLTGPDGEGIPTTYWDVDERLEESLAKILGRTPAWIETLADDDVLVSVEGKLPQRIHELNSVEV